MQLTQDEISLCWEHRKRGIETILKMGLPFHLGVSVSVDGPIEQSMFVWQLFTARSTDSLSYRIYKCQRVRQSDADSWGAWVCQAIKKKV